MLAAEGAAVPGAMTFVTPAVTEGGMLAGGGAGAGGGMLADGGGATGAAAGTGGQATAGMSSLDAIAASQPGYTAAQGEAAMNAVAASQPGYNAAGGTALENLKAGSTMQSLGKGAATYGRMSQAMGGGQQQRAPAPGQPLFQGEQPSIAGGMGARGSNNNAVLAAIARSRARGI
ncbi:MAG: hypothetical protein AB1807_12045 [Pseudomonadota bacterium]